VAAYRSHRLAGVVRSQKRHQIFNSIGGPQVATVTRDGARMGDRRV